MNEKKNIVITFRVDEKTKEKIDKIANRKEWSTAQTIEHICKNYFQYIEKHEKTPTDAINEYQERIEEEIEGIDLSLYENKTEDLINEILRLINQAKEG